MTQKVVILSKTLEENINISQKNGKKTQDKFQKGQIQCPICG